MQFRIGDRDPVTGLYDVIWPDGSSTRNGIKTFNSAHQTGDTVLVSKRSDGMLILDSAKAITTDDLTRSIANPDLVTPPPSYLQGQVFNRPEEKMGLAFVTTNDVFTPAYQNNDDPRSIAYTAPAPVNWDPAAGGVVFERIIYSKTYRPTRIALSLSSNLLPIVVIPSNNAAFFVGAGSNVGFIARRLINFAGGGFYDAYDFAIAGNTIEFTIDPPTNINAEWLEYNFITMQFRSYYLGGGADPLAGQTVTFDLLRVGDLKLANRSISIVIP